MFTLQHKSPLLTYSSFFVDVVEAKCVYLPRSKKKKYTYQPARLDSTKLTQIGTNAGNTVIVLTHVLCTKTLFMCS